MTEDNLDAWFRILANKQRRAIVRILSETEEVPVRDLAHMVAKRTRKQPGDPTRPEYDQTLTALVHVHLPLMDGGGVIEWDRESGTVRAKDLSRPKGLE